MLKKILLASAALATLSVPAVANAQYYGRSYGTYGNGRHYYWDGHHYRDRNNNAVLDTIIAGLLGYAVGAATTGSYGYGYPGYAYGSPYGYGYSSSAYSYPGYGYGSPYGYGYSSGSYGYPGYGYNYQYSRPSYGYGNYCAYYRC
jgi:hypothetical protein